MNNKENHTAKLVEIGIEYQRNANISKAIEQYTLAYNNYPFYKDIYKNLGIAFIGKGDYESAMRSFLIYAHYIIFDGKIDMSSFEHSAYLNYYNWSGNYSTDKTIEKDLHLKAVATDFNLAKIVSNIELVSNVGMVYLTRHQEIVNYNRIEKNLIMNDLRLMLGREKTGTSLRESDFAPLVRNIGFAFLLKNLLTTPDLTLDDILKIYFSENYSLDDL